MTAKFSNARKPWHWSVKSQEPSIPLVTSLVMVAALHQDSSLFRSKLSNLTLCHHLSLYKGARICSFQSIHHHQVNSRTIKPIALHKSSKSNKVISSIQSSRQEGNKFKNVFIFAQIFNQTSHCNNVDWFGYCCSASSRVSGGRQIGSDLR